MRKKMTTTLVFIVIIGLYGQHNSKKLVNSKKNEIPLNKSNIILSLNQSIQDGINLLESSKYVEFINRFMNPNEKEKLLKGLTVEEFVEKEFKQKSAAGILAILKSIKNQKPTLINNGTTAQFKVDKKLTKTRKDVTLSFTKIDGKWYLNR